MTLTESDRNELVLHRKGKAWNLYNEALFLIESKLYNTAVNRIYYGMYHIVSALALMDNYSTSKHLQLIGWFNHKYIKGQVVDKNMGKYIMRAFEMRSKGDYDDFITYTESEVKELFFSMKLFIETLEKLLP